jgi:rhodanese-related sulfurtransferase
MRGKIVGMVVLLALSGFAAGVQAETATVTVDQVKERLQAGGAKSDLVVLDVRTPREFAEGHLVGAVNLDIQASDFSSRLQALDRGRTYLVYCRTGNRSIRAVRAMEELGFRSILHMPQGIVRWQERRFPVATAS